MRPAAHDAGADRVARLHLLGATGAPDPLGGRIVLMSTGMSNTTQEYQRFMQLAAADATRNRGVVLVDGAQGGWSADRLSDPAQNASYWATVSTRLTAAEQNIGPARGAGLLRRHLRRGGTARRPRAPAGSRAASR